jgi:hypothetical protein
LSTIPPLKGKRNNYNLSFQRNTYGVGNPSPGKGQALKCGRIKGVNGAYWIYLLLREKGGVQTTDMDLYYHFTFIKLPL